MIRREALQVYFNALAAAVGVLLANLMVERQFEVVLSDRVLCWASAFATVQIGLIVLMSAGLLAVRTYARLRENLHEQIRPAIRDRVMALAFEGETWSSAVPANGPGRQVLEDNLAHALGTVKAAGRDRVARFAIEYGFAAQWLNALSAHSKSERKRAVSLLGLISPVAGNAALFTGLRDAHSEVRAEAYRALLVAGDVVSLDQVFRSVLEESLLMRALLADDLKRHAGRLLAHTIPEVLKEGTPLQAARCFEILIAWKRALPGFDVRPWLASERDTPLVPLLLRLLPYLLTDDSAEGYVASALESADQDTQIAAAEAAGRLRLSRLIPALRQRLAENRRLALAAANALAQLGQAGAQVLEQTVAGADRRAAAVAMEALEHTMVSR